MVRSADRGRTFWSLQIMPIVLFAFDSILLRCSSKFSFLSSYIPKSFWEFVLATGTLLKVKGGWDVIDLFAGKNKFMTLCKNI